MKSANIRNRTQRNRLAVAHDPYWHELAAGQHLGYRKGKRAGKWIARFLSPGNGYSFATLGTADDTVPANGTHILSFEQATEAAQAWMNGAASDKAAGIHIGPYTVADAAADWLKRRPEGVSKRNAEGTLKHHILPTLGTVLVKELTRQQIADWLDELADKKPVKVAQREATNGQEKLSPSRRSKLVYKHDDPETRRKRRDTANRVLNDLKAILHLAYKNQRLANRAVFDTVARFENAAKPKDVYLSLDEANRCIEAAPEDFRTLVHVALMTGARYGELCSLKAGAYDPRTQTLTIMQTKTGKVKRLALTEAEADTIAKLATGKSADDLLLVRADGKAWTKSMQQHRIKAAARAAGITRHVRFHDLRHTFASLLISNGASIHVVANQLGHSSTAMAERTYAHLSPEYIGSTVRAKKPAFGVAAAA